MLANNKDNKKSYDSHTHSLCSDDGRDSVVSLCELAIKRGLAGIAVTDHCDIDLGREACESAIRCLASEVAEARERFGGMIELSMGIELGEAHHNPQLALEMAYSERFDFIIGALHRLRGEEDFYFIDYGRSDLPSLLCRYYDELIEMAELGYFDVMAHIGYQIRYMDERAKKIAREMDFSDRIEELLKILADSCKGIEVNTTSMKMGEEGIFPTPEVLRMFREAGGVAVTTGSDAHLAERVGYGIAEAEARLLDAGFERVYFYKGRMPVGYNIC